MSAAQHTPGPWHRNIKPASKYPTVWSGRNTHVAAISPGAPRRSGDGCTMSEAEQEANIDLIAAAPCLLAALRDLYDLVDCGSSPDAFKNGVTDSSGSIDEGDVRASRYMDAARAAIAKAEGR